MFEIEYKGANTVVISTKKSTLVTDPKMSVHGEKDYVVKNAIELATEERFAANDEDFALSISCPGSYEVGDFSINGFAEKRHLDGENDGKKAVVYSIDVLGVKIGLLGFTFVESFAVFAFTPVAKRVNAANTKIFLIN